MKIHWWAVILGNILGTLPSVFMGNRGWQIVCTAVVGFVFSVLLIHGIGVLLANRKKPEAR